MQGQVTWARAREKPLDLLPALYLSVDAPLLVQSSSATLPNLSRPQLWSSHLAGAHERQAFDHCCGRVAKLALERRRVQQRCPRAPTPEPGKGRRPKNRQSQRRKVFLPGYFVFSLSWPACAGAFLVPGCWFSGPAPSGSCLFLFRLMFLSTGRGRHVPAPSGRDVGSSAGAPTQEPALSRYPLYAVRFNLDFAYKRTSAWWFSSCSSPSFSSSLCKTSSFTSNLRLHASAHLMLYFQYS